MDRRTNCSSAPVCALLFVAAAFLATSVPTAFASSALLSTAASAELRLAAASIAITDADPPQITDARPARDAFDVPPTAGLSFAVEDLVSGVDPATLNVTVEMQLRDTTTWTLVTPASGYPKTDLTFLPTRLGWTFNPASPFPYLAKIRLTVAVSDNFGNPLGTPANQWQFQILAPPTSLIRGTIRLAGGTVVPGVTVHVGTFVVVTDASGVYEAPGLSDGTYEVRPELGGKAFVPAVKVIRVPPDQVGIDFTAVTGYPISGRVTLDDGTTPVAGVKVSAGAKSTLTLADGTYEIIDLAAGSYSVYPTLLGLIFNPTAHPVTLTSAGVSGQDFQAHYAHYSVGGRVSLPSGGPLPGVSITAYDSGSNPVAVMVTGDGGTYQLTGLLAGRYTLRATKAGWDFAPRQLTLDIASDLTGINFGALTVLNLDLGTSLHFVGIPLYPTSSHPLDVFGAGARVARFDPTVGSPADPWVFATAGPAPDLLTVAPGKGFWVKEPSAGALQISGVPQSPSTPLSVTVDQGWNMLANPFSAAMPWSATGIVDGMPLRNVGFIYDPGSGSYITVSSIPGVGVLSTVPAHSGFWLYALDRTSVTFGAISPSSASAKVVQPAATDCLLHVVASTRTSSDATTVVGFIAGHEVQAENPPAMPGMIDLYIDEGQALAASVRSKASVSMSWDLTVRVPDGAGEVAISTPDLSRVPASKQVTLTDVDGGRSVYLRTQPRYVFTASAGLRHLKISIEDRAVGGLTVSAASAHQRSGSAVVTFSLSRSARVSAEVMNMAGRPICTIAADQPASGGVNSLAWNLRNRQGSLVSPGRYIIKLTAVADDGQQVTGLTQLTVGR